MTGPVRDFSGIKEWVDGIDDDATIGHPPDLNVVLDVLVAFRASMAWCQARLCREQQDDLATTIDRAVVVQSALERLRDSEDDKDDDEGGGVAHLQAVYEAAKAWRSAQIESDFDVSTEALRRRSELLRTLETSIDTAVRAEEEG